MAGPISYGETSLAALGAALIARLAAGTAITNPVYEGTDGADGTGTTLFEIPLDAAAPGTYGVGGIVTWVRDSGVFTGLRPTGVATGTLAGFRIRGRNDVVEITGDAGTIGSGNALEMATLSVVDTELMDSQFSAEPTHTIQ